MAHPNDDRPDPLKPTAVTNKPADQRLPAEPEAGNGGVTGTQPGMPEREVTNDPGTGSARKDLPGIDPSGTNTDRTRPGADEAVDNERNPTNDGTDSTVGDEPREHRTRAND